MKKRFTRSGINKRAKRAESIYMSMRSSQPTINEETKMPDYKEMYLAQVRASISALEQLEKAAEIIKAAHQATEEMYIAAEDLPILHRHPELTEDGVTPDGDGKK
jgi:hypothetical protein